MVFCVLCCAIMFLRSTIRRKDGKEHRYWSIVENKRLRDGRVVQRAALYLGEINSSQERAWRRSIEVLDETAPAEPQTIALFPEDRCEAEAADQAIVRLRLSRLELRRRVLRRGFGAPNSRERNCAMLTVRAYGPPFAPREGQKASKTYLSRNEGIPEGPAAIL